MTIIGILSIKNATFLNYPFIPTIKSLSRLCDKVLVGVDPNYPIDLEELQKLNLTNMVVIKSVWEDTKQFGIEIARQMDLLVSYAESEFKADWVMVLQADEVVHEDDFLNIRNICDNLSKTYSGVSSKRLYFWESLDVVRVDWEVSMTRLFRPSYRSFQAEGTDKAGMHSGPVTGKLSKVYIGSFPIYHYSRVGDPLAISKRVRNLDTFFHDEENLIPVEDLQDYDFKTREYDNFNVNEKIKEVEGVFCKFEGTHPVFIRNYFNLSST